MDAELITFSGLPDDKEHIAIRLGPDAPEVPLVRIHSECLTGDVFGSLRCDCGPQLGEALVKIETQGGYLLYLRQEGRGIGLYNKLDAYRLQDEGFDTFTANQLLGRADDERDYAAAAAMLHCLAATEIDLLTNNPDKVAQIRGSGIRVRHVQRTGVHSNPHNRHYLEAKVSKARHAIEWEGVTRA